MAEIRTGLLVRTSSRTFPRFASVILGCDNPWAFAAIRTLAAPPSVSMLARLRCPEKSFWPSSSPSRAGLPPRSTVWSNSSQPTWSASTRTILSRTGVGRDDDPGGGEPPDQLRRQAAAPDADAGHGATRRLWRRRSCQARRGGRVHAHRDAAARRRGRRERHAARAARCPHAVGQRGERAGRRFPARPGLQDDGRGRLAARAGDPLVRRRRDRRGRGDAARRREEHRDHRGRVSAGDPRQDGGIVRRGLRGRPGDRQRGRRPNRRPAARSA